MAQLVPFRLQRLFEVFGERVELEGRLGRGNNEVVGEAGSTRDIEEGDIERLAFGKHIHSALGERFGFQEEHSRDRRRPWQGRAVRRRWLNRPDAGGVGKDLTIGAKKPRVVVGMSGGVDSSVAAALLCEHGYEVIGVTMRLWTEERPEEFSGHQQCCSVEDIDDARRVAGQLGIRHYVLNFEEQFREHVVDRFVAEYAAGRTPNPCVRCNEHIKYRALLERLPAFEAEYVATGHYARVVHDPHGRHRLLRATDLAKDQSYVLYMLQQAQLAQLILPIGGLTKAEVRSEARRLGLDVAAKPDSVEICFVPGNDYRSFVEARVAPAPGELRDGAGAVVGEHRGVAAYTLGQRKGLGVAVGEARFVTAIDAVANVVTIGPEEELFADTVAVSEVRWMAGVAPAPGTVIEAKARYRAEPAEATLVGSAGETAEVRFERRQRALTPGQAIAFYADEEVLGGGTIDRAWRASRER